MRDLLFILGFIFAFVSGAAHADRPEFSIQIYAKQDIANAGEDLRIDVVTKNNSTHSAIVSRGRGRNHAEGDFKVRVTDENGAEVPKTAYYRMLRDGVIEQPPPSTHTAIAGFQSSETAVTLAPDGRYVDSFFVNRLYELNIPGRYTIQLARDFPPLGNGNTSYSNKLSITIAKPK